MCQGKSKEPACKGFSLHGQLHENSMQNPCQLNIRAFRMTYYCLVRWHCRWSTTIACTKWAGLVLCFEGSTWHSCALSYRRGRSFRQPPSTAGPPVASTTSRTDGLCATPQPSGRRQRPQGQIQDAPTQIAPQLTEQDPRMAAGAVVFDCRPALLPVSVDVSGIAMRAVRSAIPPVEPVVVPPELEQQFGGADLFDYIGLELDVAPLLDPGTDCEDEWPSPDGLPTVISPVVPLLPAQVEEDVDLTQILAEFGTLPAIVTPINDPHEEREMPPEEYRPPEVPADLFVTPVGRMTVLGGHRRGRWAVRQVLWRLRRLLRFRRQRGTCCSQNRSGLVRRPGERRRIIDYRRFPYRLLRLCLNQWMYWMRTNVPDLSREGQFDIRRDGLRPDASLRSWQDRQGCSFRITSYDLEIDGSDFSPEYGYWDVAQNTGSSTWGRKRLSLPRCSYSMMLD